MTNPAGSRRRLHRSNALLLLLIFGLAAAAAIAFTLLDTQESHVDVLLRRVAQARVGGGRFFRASKSQPSSDELKEALHDADVYLASEPESVETRHLRALVDAGDGRLQEAASALTKLVDEDVQNPELLNDLGVVYLGLGGANAVNYFKAADLFEHAAKTAPSAPAPRFNAAIALREGQIDDLAELELKEFRRLEPRPIVGDEPPDVPPSATSLLEQLDRMLIDGDTARAKELLDRYPTHFRRIAMERALNPPEVKSLSEASAFAMDHFANAGNDRTARAILAPLQGAERDRVMKARRLVQKGVNAYYKGQPIESLQLHDQAAVAMGNDAPDFDRLWMKLKRADALLRNARPPDGVQNAATARRLMDEVVSESRTLGFDWLLGQALVSKTAASANMQDFNYTLPILHEALARLSSVGTPEDLVRPLNYLAMVYSIAGDAEKSLDTTYQALRLTAPDDNVRLAQLYWIAGLQLSRMGYTRYSKTLEQKAVRYAYASDNPGVIAGIVPALGSRQAREGDYETAEKILHEIGMLRSRVRAAGEEELFSLSFNLLCSQVMKGKGDPDHAENCLKENLRVLDKQTIAPPGFFAETLLQLGGIQWANSDFDGARDTFRRAIEVIEVNDAYLATSVLRMPFESQRRDIYDMAIGFEYDQNTREAAWDYAQRYRSKLFLEFLRQKNPNVLDRAINRADAQRLIPENLQVLEYVVLKDRLLIWLVSRDKFFSVSVSVTRGDIEGKVSSLLADINRKKDIEKQSSELYRLLIEPVEAELDPKKTLAIIPDLALHRLNFPALYSAATEKFLIQKYAILESPNLTTLLSVQNGPRTHGRVVAFGARQDSVGAAEELHALKKIYGDIETFNGPAALKPAFLSSLTSASTLHYVGHSQDAADPLRSSILLDGDREGPNSVTAADISNQKMPANSVVVLASCDSSVGNSRDGIGMRGLTSAFLISGAGSVVGSLWLVESESTSQLVLRFHKDFAAGTPAIVALRNAQLALIEKGDHPYYWSGFVVTGNTSALR